MANDRWHPVHFPIIYTYVYIEENMSCTNLILTVRRRARDIWTLLRSGIMVPRSSMPTVAASSPIASRNSLQVTTWQMHLHPHFLIPCRRRGKKNDVSRSSRSFTDWGRWRAATRATHAWVYRFAEDEPRDRHTSRHGSVQRRYIYCFRCRALSPARVTERIVVTPLGVPIDEEEREREFVRPSVRVSRTCNRASDWTNGRALPEVRRQLLALPASAILVAPQVSQSALSVTRTRPGIACRPRFSCAAGRLAAHVSSVLSSQFSVVVASSGWRVCLVLSLSAAFQFHAYNKCRHLENISIRTPFHVFFQFYWYTVDIWPDKITEKKYFCNKKLGQYINIINT